MDLLDFDSTGLYFEEPLSDTVQAYLNQASESYADNEAELPLLRAYLLNHDSLTVLVALYRFYFYQHCLDDALHIALLARQVSARSLNIEADWQNLALADFPQDAHLKGLVRFYLMVLKGDAVATSADCRGRSHAAKNYRAGPQRSHWGQRHVGHRTGACFAHRGQRTGTFLYPGLTRPPDDR